MVDISNDNLHVSVRKSSSFYQQLLFLFILFEFDALQLIFVLNVLQSVFFIFIKLNGVGASPLEKFLFKKENDNVCELKGASSKRNCIGTSNAQKRDLYCVF